MKARISDYAITSRQARLVSGRVTLPDTAMKGFFVEIRSRSATFNLRNSIDGKMRVINLGRFPEMSADQARAKALAYKQQVNQGASADDIIKSNKSVTLDQFYHEHFLPWYKTYRRNSANIIQMYRSTYFTRFGDRHLHTISQADLRNLSTEMKRLGYAPGSINRAVVTLRAMLKRADDWDICRMHSSLKKSPDLLRDTRKLERFLSREEAQRLQTVLRERGPTPVNLAILFMLYTGARRKEVLEAEWQYIDFSRREWRIPITKNGQPRTVILSGKAMEILQQAEDYQERNFVQPVGIVFANPKTLQPYYNIWETWKRVRAEADLEDVRLHDLRHSFASTLINAGVSIYEVQKLLGHSNVTVTQRYAHLASERLHETIKLVDEGYGED